MSFECVDCGVFYTSETDLQIHEESHRGNEAGPSPSGRNSPSTQFVSIDDDDVGTDSDDESSVVTRVSSCRRDLDDCSLGDPPKRERPPKSKKVDQGCTCTPGTSFASEDIGAPGTTSSISGSNEENDVHMMSPPKNTFIGNGFCQPSFNVSSPAGMSTSTSAAEQIVHQGVDSASESERTNDTLLDPVPEETDIPPIKLEPTELGHIKRNAELVSTTRAKSRRRDKLPAAGSTEYRQIRNADAKRRRDLNATRYSCDYCDFTASFPSKLKLHLASNHTKGRFKCSSCTAVFDTQSEQRKHLSVVHPLSHYCEKCGYSNKKAAYVRRHIQQVHQSGRQFQCTVPGCKVMLLKQQLKAHLSSVHHVGAVSSTSCPRDPTLAAARGRNPTGPQLICPHCQFQVDTTQELDEHVQLLHGSGVLCPMVDCDERVHLDQLEMHISTMHPNFAVEMPAPQVLTRRVPSCGDGSVLTESETTMTSSTTTLAEDQMLSSSDEEDGDWNPEKAGENRSHVGLATKNSLGGYDCSNCAGNFSTIYLLKKHVKRVHARQYSECKKRVKELKHKCTWEGCTKAFRTIGFLEDHLNKHKGLTPYQCDHCRQSFFARARFAVHLSKYHQTSIRSYKAIGNALPQMHNGAGGEETTT